jgi:hypothetical protein
MREGRINGEVQGDTLTESTIALLATSEKPQQIEGETE